MLLAIDPGTTHSALVILNEAGMPANLFLGKNESLISLLRAPPPGWPFPLTRATPLAIERVESYGMPVGEEVFETCRWAGRFHEAWAARCWGASEIFHVPRRAVKLHLCGSARARDSNIRAALIDRYGPGRRAAMGLKASPGPLYGVKQDLWAALAVAVTVHDTLLKAPVPAAMTEG